MKLRNLFRNLIILALLVILITQSFQKEEEKVDISAIPDSYLRAPLNDDDLNFDPSGAWYATDIEIYNVIYDALYIFDTNGNTQANLAADLPEISDDGLVYTIQLKENIKFHDDLAFENGVGRELIAEDIIYSLKRIADPSNESGLWSLIQGKISGLDEYREALEDASGSFDDKITGLFAKNDKELEIHLTQPYTELLSVLAMPSFSIVPKEAVEKYQEEFKNHPVGTGPFSLVEYEPNKTLVVKRVDGHWRSPEDTEGELPEGIIFRYFDDQWNAFKDDDLDVFLINSERLNAYFDNNFEVKEDLKELGYGSYAIKEAYRNFMIFNYKDPLMNNIHLRKAISYAIPWEKLIDEEDTLSAALIPDPISGSVDLRWEYNPEKAKQELILAGYPNGEGLPELIYRNRWPIRLYIAAMVQDALEEIGIKVHLELKDVDELEDAHLGGQGWVLDYPDASNILNLLSSKNLPPDGNNYGYYQNEEFDSLVEEALTLDDDERHKYYEEISKWLYDNVVVIPFRQTYLYSGLSPRIKKIYSDPIGYIIWAEVEMEAPTP